MVVLRGRGSWVWVPLVMGPGELDYGSWISVHKEYTNLCPLLRTPNWSWWDPGFSALPYMPVPSVAVSQSASLYYGPFSDHQDYRNSHAPHTWPVVPLLVRSLQVWPSLTVTWPNVDFSGGKMLWKWYRKGRRRRKNRQELSGLNPGPGNENGSDQGDSVLVPSLQRRPKWVPWAMKNLR